MDPNLFHYYAQLTEWTGSTTMYIHDWMNGSHHRMYRNISECKGNIIEWIGHVTKCIGRTTLIFESWSTYHFCFHKPKHIWQWVVNTQVVGLVWAGLATEWIYDAFAGKSSFKCNVFHFTLDSMNSPTSCRHFSMYFQVLSNGTLLEVWQGMGWS